MGLGVKTALQVAIARNRRSPMVKALHAVSEWVESSFENVGSDFVVNGEKAFLHRMAPANFKTVLDVGANVGEWLEQAIAAWPQCHVHAFEVAPETANTLEANVARRGQSGQVTIHRCGASDAPGVQTLYYFPRDPQLTCDMPRHNMDEAVPFEAKMVTLDAFADEQGIEAVDFLKIDVEGAEHRVLDGFKRRLASQAVKVIQFEYGPFATDTRVLLKDFYGRLGENYWIGKIFPNGVDFQDYRWELEDFRFANYVCVLKSQPELRQLAAASR